MGTAGVIALSLLGVGLIIFGFYILARQDKPIGYHGIFQTSVEIDRMLKKILGVLLLIGGGAIIYFATVNW
jgi:hypothetical protein